MWGLSYSERSENRTGSPPHPAPSGPPSPAGEGFGAHPWRSVVGARHASPAEFHTPNRRGAKASPGGEAVATSVATDEVEAKNYHQRKVRHCYPRPHPSRAKARDTFPSRGRLFSVPAGFCVDFYCSNIPGQRAGHAAAPTRKIDTASRPTSVTPKGVTPCSSGMTATGSHGYFYSLRGAQPQGEGFSLKPSLPTS